MHLTRNNFFRLPGEAPVPGDPKKRGATYLAAKKTGDLEAAARLAEAHVPVKYCRAIADKYPDAKLLYVQAQETGKNVIPQALAYRISDATGMEVISGVYQSNVTGHTDTGAAYRLATPPTFEGEIPAGAKVILVDDMVTTASTLAALHRYVTAQGAEVVAMASLGSLATRTPATTAAPSHCSPIPRRVSSRRTGPGNWKGSSMTMATPISGSSPNRRRGISSPIARPLTESEKRSLLRQQAEGDAFFLARRETDPATRALWEETQRLYPERFRRTGSPAS